MVPGAEAQIQEGKMVCRGIIVAFYLIFLKREQMERNRQEVSRKIRKQRQKSLLLLPSQKTKTNP